MKHSRWISILIALALVLSLGPVGVPGQSGGSAKAEESEYQDLNQQEILEAMGAGWNLGNQLEANLDGTPVEDGWTGTKITERLIRTVKTSGFQSIRIPVSYLSKIGVKPDYTIDDVWMDRIQEVVDWALKYKLYVIINIHGDGYSTVTGGWLLPSAGDEAQETIKAKYEAVWKQIADRFKDYDQHLIFESMNEVGADIAGTTNADKQKIQAAYQNINAYNQIFVDTVRQSGGNNDRRWLLIPGLNTDINYTVGDYGFQIPEDAHLSASIPEGQKRLMISVHYYNPWAFCGTETYVTTQWGEDGAADKKVGYGSEDDMVQQFAKLKSAFTSKGYPVVIGEYGSIDKSKKKDSGLNKDGEPDPDNTKYRAYYAKMLCLQSIQNGCIPVYWDNGWNGDFGFGIIDRKTCKVTQPEILDAIVSSYSQKEGTATAIALDQKTMLMDLVDGKKTLKATLTPADAKDNIQWESSNEAVASVSFNGAVTPKGAGSCVITATLPNGLSAYCLVKIKGMDSFKGGLYASNAEDWNTLEGDNYLEISQDGGGTYTISLSGTKEQMSKLNSLFIKDVTVQKGVSETSILNSAQFEVNSAKFNDKDCAMAIKSESYVEGDAYDNGKPTGKRTVPDICMLNIWYPVEPEPFLCWFDDFAKNKQDNSGGSFPSEYYVDGTNTLTMNVTVKDAVLKKDYAPAEVDVASLSLSRERLAVRPAAVASLSAAVQPDNATEKVLWFSENIKIAQVAQDGTVTGINPGETVIHAMTYSGQDVACAVKVSEDAEEEPAATPGGDSGESPGTEPTATPGGDSGGNAGAESTATPSPSPSKDPGESPGAEPTAAPSQKPGAEPTKTPDADQPIQKVPAKGTAFAVGNLTYKVTSTAAGKAKASVKGPKSKKAKSLTIPASVKYGGISYAVTSVGSSAFKKCKKLKKVTIGKNVVTIGSNAFSGDKALKKIIVKSAKIKKVGKNALKGIHKKAVVKVPKKKLKKYRKLWKKKGQKKSVKIQ